MPNAAEKPTRRLYIVRIVREAYVLATDEEEAKEAKDEIERFETSPVVTVQPWAGRNIKGWYDDCLVFGTQDDVKLRQAKKVDAATAAENR